MGAPKGNNFWTMRSKHGRDKIFQTPELMEKAALEYFQSVIDNPFMVAEKGQGNTARFYAGDDANGNPIYKDNVVYMPRIKPFTIMGFCRYCGADVDFLAAFERSFNTEKKDDPRKKDFLAVIKWIRDVIKDQQLSAASSGLLKENIISRVLGLADNINNKNENVNYNSQPLDKDEIKSIAKGLDDEL